MTDQEVFELAFLSIGLITPQDIQPKRSSFGYDWPAEIEVEFHNDTGGRVTFEFDDDGNLSGTSTNYDPWAHYNDYAGSCSHDD